MNRADLEAYIQEQYGTDADHPWAKYPNHQVFRHKGNRKWFALVMDVPKEKLGLRGKEPLDIVNLKCDPVIIGSLINNQGIFPAYHMSKASWITVALDGSVPSDEMKALLHMSYDATAGKGKKANNAKRFIVIE